METNPSTPTNSHTSSSDPDNGKNTNFETKPTAKISNWYHDRSRNVLVGEITGHKMGDGYGNTSLVISFNKNRTTCETLNTIYVLGTEMKPKSMTI